MSAGDESQRKERDGVWIVDDSPLQLAECRVALESHFKVRTFASGSAVVEAIGAGAPPDVLVLDWLMPDISGLEVCRFIREQFTPGELPVVVLTASASTESVLEALGAGANDFVRKPLSALEIRARVSGLVKMSTMHSELLETQRKLLIEAEFRERFMGMLAHDLRQPLNTMVLVNQALSLAETPPSKVAGALAMQLRAAGRMKRMIGELLDLARSRPATGIPIQPQPSDLATIARTVVDEMKPGWPGRELSLSVHEPCVGLWDPDRLAQVCSNLIGNALEHSAADSPIEVRVIASPAFAELTVSNQGPAIAPELLATLFEPFRRIGGVKRSRDGVGLGLYIVAQIVRAHAGTVSAESTDTQTRFCVRLPLDP